jgi:adenylosuccinate synthase
VSSSSLRYSRSARAVSGSAASPSEANYRSFDGWEPFDSETVASEGYAALPENARAYLEYLSDELDTSVYCVGVGPGREQTVIREGVWE